MSALDQIATARDDVFSSRVAMIQLKVAQNVASEDPGTANHAERIAYAEMCIRGAENPKLVAAHLISANPAIQIEIDGAPELKGSNVPDGDIEFALATIWDSRSLAFAAAPA